jgi:hypothetical protein
MIPSESPQWVIRVPPNSVGSTAEGLRNLTSGRGPRRGPCIYRADAKTSLHEPSSDAARDLLAMLQMV